MSAHNIFINLPQKQFERFDMRIYLKTTPNNQFVPIDYQQKLVGTIHKWIGKNNDLHGHMSLFSFSWLHGSKFVNGTLLFRQGAKFFISIYDEGIVKNMMRSILNAPQMFCGLEVTDIQLFETPDLAERMTFYYGSPIFIKRRLENGQVKQYTYSDTESAELMKKTLVNKMRIAGLVEDETLNIKFDTSYQNKRTKLIHYHGIGNKASLCPIIINAKPETKQFAWDVGIGNCTGIGFGAIY